MAKLFRYILSNFFFTTKRVLFQHREENAVMEGHDIKGGSSRTIEDVYKKKTKPSPKAETSPKEPPYHPISLLGNIRVLLTKFSHSTLAFIVTSSVKITVEGKENLPGTSQPALIVSNHSSYLDAPVIGVAFSDNLIDLSWVVSKSNYNIWFLKWLWLILKPVVVERGGTVDKIKYDLNNNRWVVLFPEGNEKWCPPSEAAKKRAKPSNGAAVVALSTGVTVIPVGITGADKVLPAMSFKLDRRYHITVRIGKSFSYTKVNAESIDHGLLAETRQEIMNRVYSLIYYQHQK